MRETVKQYHRRISRKGGKARAKALTPARRSEIAKLGAAARWPKKPENAA